MCDILTAAGEKSCMISSGERSVEDQARIMYEQAVKRGAAAQYKLYGPFGDLVIDVFVANKWKGEPACRAAMAAKIKEIGGYKVSHHVCGGTDCHVWVFDVDPDSIKNHTAFVSAVDANQRVVKFLQPPDDLAFHFEILKSVEKTS